ncbi:MAG: bifunctional chorismate mutase/prephenate dehydrogenase [Burkholderiales bacterium]|nr:bifunctional chorismate mutase/prephenate dehydrogenase [Burkholderiales bacterium]
MFMKKQSALNKHITIIGGSGLMGQLFAKYWRSAGANVNTLGRNEWNKASELLGLADLIIICVPINETCDVITKACEFIKPNSILADFTSIKQSIINHMQERHSGPVLGLHPMFGPTINSPLSQVIINCGGRDTEKSSWVIDSLAEIGFTIRIMSAHEHDLAMSFIQGIEHFSTFALGSFLKQQNMPPHQLFSIASPIYQAKLALLGRIFHQDANLYANIIMSDAKRIELIGAYIKHMQDWLDKLKTNQHKEFVTEFNDTGKWMGDFTHQSQLASDQFLSEFTNIFNLK